MQQHLDDQHCSILVSIRSTCGDDRLVLQCSCRAPRSWLYCESGDRVCHDAVVSSLTEGREALHKLICRPLVKAQRAFSRV